MGRFSSLPFMILGALILCSNISRSQGIFKISTEEKISRSSLVVEGKSNQQKILLGRGSPHDLYF